MMVIWMHLEFSQTRIHPVFVSQRYHLAAMLSKPVPSKRATGRDFVTPALELTNSIDHYNIEVGR